MCKGHPVDAIYGVGMQACIKQDAPSCSSSKRGVFEPWDVDAGQ